MQLSQSAIYALQTLLHLAESGEGTLVTRKVWRKEDGCPSDFSWKSSIILVKWGILRSTRGSGGGFALARCPEDITFWT